MTTKPKAIESFEEERDNMNEFMSIAQDHPIDRLKHHILQTKGKIVKSEFSNDGTAYVIWECQGIQYRAWSTWPDQDTKVNWKLLK